EDIKLLKLDVMLRDNALVDLRKKFKKAEQERDELKLKLEKFQTSSKNQMFDSDELIGSESDVSMPTSLVYDRYKSGEGYHVVPPPYIGTFMPPKPDLVFHDAPTVNETVPTVFNVEPKDESKGEAMPIQKAPSFVHILQHVKTPKTSVKPVEHPIPAENLRKDIPKNHAMRGNHQRYARMTHPHPHRHVVPTAVLTRSRLVPLTAARPVTTVVPQTKVQHQRPTKHGVTKGNPQHALKDKEVIDSGCSRHMTEKISYLSDFEEINGGYVAFGRNPKGGKITGKGKIRTWKLDFDDVYFVKELKFNLFSVSQMCDKKNSVLFTDTECIVLSSDFKLPDDNHVLLRVPRENNMYNVDLKNIVPSGDLTCLFLKATLDESNLWHRRLGHINFKTINKLVKGFMRPFGCPMTILNTLDPLGKFNGKADEGFLVGYSNTNANATFEVKESESAVHVSPSSCEKTKKHDDKTKSEAKGKSPVNTAGPSNTAVNPTLGKSSYVDPSQYPDDPDMPALEDIAYSDDEEDVSAEADFSSLETNINVSPIPTTRVHKDHPVTQIISDLSSAPQTRSMTRMVKEQGRLTQINNDDFHTCMFACFLSQEEPKRVHQALKDPSWIEAMQEELFQFKIQKVLVLVDLSKGKRAIGSKWVFRKKKDERGIVIRNKPRLVAQGHTKEEGIDYEEVFALIARIEAIRLFLAYASFMGFMVYKVVKALYGLNQALKAWCETLANYLLENGFQRGKIDQTLLIKKQKGDILLVHVYVDDIIFGSTNKELCKAFEKLMKDKFQKSSMGELTFFLGLQVKQKQRGIFISQDKYVAKILRKFGLTDEKSASTPIYTEKPLLKDPDGEDVDVHTYRSMIGSLMYLTSSRQDIMYLKGKPHLGLWYPKDSPFNLMTYFDSDYAGESLDRKSTIGGNQPNSSAGIQENLDAGKVVKEAESAQQY
nr:retrovirus-related Pol polyprotein from transposon TNT 1-94 [Tanacetum cinerariifolium]